MYEVIFGVLTYFVIYGLIFLFVILVELLGLAYASFLFMRIILLIMFTCRNLLVKSPVGGCYWKAHYMGMLVKSPWWGWFIHFLQVHRLSLERWKCLSRSFVTVSFFWRGRLGWVASSSHLYHKLNKASLKEKFHCPNPRQALKTSLSTISMTGRIFDCHNSLITNRWKPFIGPLESWEDCLPKRYSGLLEFQPIRDWKLKIRSATVLFKNRIQQWRRSSKFHIFWII
jgi:hypothetical protein